jgi:hypothetical protein
MSLLGALCVFACAMYVKTKDENSGLRATKKNMTMTKIVVARGEWCMRKNKTMMTMVPWRE